MIRTCIGGSVLLLVLFAASASVYALPEYPDALRKAADTPCVPHCNVCHRDDNAGSGTVDRPFAKSMLKVGGLGGGGVARAVERLRSQMTDSDGDGTSDIDELQMGDDPNYSGSGDLCGPEVGCNAAHKPKQSAWWSGYVALALAAAGLRRRSRQSRARQPR